jgi:hypothetical protein
LPLQYAVPAVWLVGGSIAIVERIVSEKRMPEERLEAAVSDVFADCTIAEVEIEGDIRERYRCPEGDEGLLD